MVKTNWLKTNPQGLIRDALKEIGAFSGNSHKMFVGERSNWEPGQALKTSFYVEDAAELRSYAESQAMTAQELITRAVEKIVSEAQE